MTGKCANQWCSTLRRPNQGKLFRLDIDLGIRSGGSQRMTEYVWLCGRCAQLMHPKVEFDGDTISLRLTKNDPIPLAELNPLKPILDSAAVLRRAQ